MAPGSVLSPPETCECEDVTIAHQIMVERLLCDIDRYLHEVPTKAMGDFIKTDYINDILLDFRSIVTHAKV